MQHMLAGAKSPSGSFKRYCSRTRVEMFLAKVVHVPFPSNRKRLFFFISNAFSEANVHHLYNNQPCPLYFICQLFGIICPISNHVSLRKPSVLNTNVVRNSALLDDILETLSKLLFVSMIISCNSVVQKKSLQNLYFRIVLVIQMTWLIVADGYIYASVTSGD